MGKTININNLSKEEINSFYDFVCDYELNIKNKYGNYNLNDTKLIAFCATNHIALKNKRSKLPYLFWFSTHQDKRTKINDKAHHLMRHIRNAFAHGLIKQEFHVPRLFHNRNSNNGRAYSLRLILGNVGFIETH